MAAADRIMSSPPPGPFCYEHCVEDAELDGLGHASNVAYVVWMQAAAIAHSTVAGWGPQRYEELGTAWVVRRHEIEYLSPLSVGRRVRIFTWVATMQRVTSLRRYEMLAADDDRPVARAATLWAYIDRARGRPSRIPPDLRGAFVVDGREWYAIASGANDGARFSG